MRMALLASGAGSNLRVMLEHAASGRLAATPALVLSNNPGAMALASAREFGVPLWCKDHRGARREQFDAEMAAAIRAAGAEAVILAGYMRILSAGFIHAFSGRILNIHPAILPGFPGASAGSAALCRQARLSGCTVHFVNEEVDGGPIIIQGAVPVSAEDTLHTLMPRIQALEYRIYPQAVQWLAQGRLRVEGRRVTLLPPANQKAGMGLKAHFNHKDINNQDAAWGSVIPPLHPDCGKPDCNAGALVTPNPAENAPSASAGHSALGPWLTSPALEDF